MAWTPPPTDSASLARLVIASTLHSDRRLLDAAVAAFNNTTLAQNQRRAAMEIIVVQYAPTHAISGAFWNDPENSTLSAVSDLHQTVGDVPLTVADRRRALAAIRSAAVSDPDAHVRRVAARVVRYFDRSTLPLP
jgi:hypothetical protein